MGVGDGGEEGKEGGRKKWQAVIRPLRCSSRCELSPAVSRDSRVGKAEMAYPPVTDSRVWVCRGPQKALRTPHRSHHSVTLPLLWTSVCGRCWKGLPSQELLLGVARASCGSRARHRVSSKPKG